MGAKSLTELLRERVVIGDGAMGTMLYAQGMFLNQCFDELNLSRPELVKRVHRGYVEAGADFIETNTFGANVFKLTHFGLAEQADAINRAGVAIARECAEGAALVGASVGPTGVEMSETGRATPEEVSAAFERQCRALIEAGADFLIFETFSNPDELLLAVRAAAGLSSLPIVALLTTNEQHETIYGQRVEEAVARIAAERAVTAVGLNCSTGPSAMLTSMERIRGVTDKPVAVQPNAGMPREVDGRTMYMCTPEYMAEYAKRFFEQGARIIGGCCGSTPAHIAETVRAVRSMDRAMPREARRARIHVETADRTKGVRPVPLGEKSRIGAKLARGEKVTSIEITPPRGAEIAPMIEKVQLCAKLGVDAINIPDGPRASSRLSPLVTGVKIEQSAHIETILHVCCRDRNIIGMQSDMLGAYTIGLRNVLLITGDPPKLGEYPNATAVFDLDSIALTGVVSNLNRGLDVAGNALSGPIALTIGVGANPAAVDLDREVERFRRKVEAGAEYAITQPVFDADTLLRFLERIAPFRVPVLAGIWPFASFKNAEFMANEVPGVVVPQALLDRMAQAKTREDGRRAGVEIAREMIARIDDAVAGCAVSAPFGNVRIPLAVLGKLSPEEI